ncbi:hypothetical protein [Aestuariibaculum lutulentum]|uniref:PLAT domain-containing protein n=1 Tax=Aestuariibaculum lutulentum TaxID=2920935 RepID=A0ABS9RHH5_9FLAO|nr:hypothetical protein [Aestuariibaculum lutulentum]MCH4552406.1 hypothetical protein [Aestuariibaculum lutulentum]
MKKLIIIILSISLYCCEKDNNIIIDPLELSNFNIKNESDSDLNLEFILSNDYLNEKKKESIGTKESKIIYEAKQIGGFAFPDQTFKEIKFYTTEQGTKTLIHTISPIINEDWIMLLNGNHSENPVHFELTITNEIIN